MIRKQEVIDDWKGFQLLRRTEMWRICRAYDIPYNQAWRKDRLIQFMQDEEAKGTFHDLRTGLKKQAKYPEYLYGWPDKPRVVVDNTDKIHDVVAGINAMQPIPEASGDADDSEIYSEWLGRSKNWCVIKGDRIIHQGLSSKEEADGLHVSARG